MELAYMSVDELKTAKLLIERELKMRQQNFSLTSEMITIREFVVRAEGIGENARKISDEFEIYGYGKIVYYRSDKIGFRFEDIRDAEDCRYHLDEVVSHLKKVCF